MGSPYLLAHGMGVRVADAATTVAFPQAGTYRVWVRAKDWVPSHAGPGTFEVRVHTLGESDRVVGEIDSVHYANGSAESIVYDARRHSVIDAEPKVSLYCRWRAS